MTCFMMMRIRLAALAAVGLWLSCAIAQPALKPPLLPPELDEEEPEMRERPEEEREAEPEHAPPEPIRTIVLEARTLEKLREQLVDAWSDLEGCQVVWIGDHIVARGPASQLAVIAESVAAQGKDLPTVRLTVSLRFFEGELRGGQTAVPALLNAPALTSMHLLGRLGNLVGFEFGGGEAEVAFHGQLWCRSVTERGLVLDADLEAVFEGEEAFGSLRTTVAVRWGEAHVFGATTIEDEGAIGFVIQAEKAK